MVVREAAGEPEFALTPTQAEIDASATATSKVITAWKPFLLPYQQRWVADASPVKVCVKSRRIGMTWALACEAVWVASQPRSRGGMDVWYLCQSERDAKEFIREAAAWAKGMNSWFKARGWSTSDGVPERCEILDADGQAIMATVIRFHSGRRITILPGKNPDVLRGKDGFVIFDEAALLDIEACLTAAQALKMSMRAGRIAFLSTQRGEGNAFNKLVEDIKAKKRHVRGYSLHVVRLRDAIAEGYYHRRCLMQGTRYSKARERTFFRNCMAELGAAQEYDCIPARDGEQYFPRDLVERVQRRGRPVVRLKLPPKWELQGTAEEHTETIRKWCDLELAPLLEKLVPWESHFVGWDFARSGDLSVCAPMSIRQDKERHCKVRSVPFLVELVNVPFDQQAEICAYIVSRLPNFRSGKWDAGGNGHYLAEFATKTYGERRAEGVHLSRKWYEEHVPTHKAAMQSAELEVPDSDDLVNDYGAFALDDSIPLLPKKRGKGAHGEQRHGDAAMAIILADAASRRPPINMGVAQSVPSARELRAW